jgi:hypothetical protein
MGRVSRPSFRPLLEALEARWAPAAHDVRTGMSFTSIQAAVNAALPNDTINIDPGSYTEQIVIGPGKNGLTLHSTTLQGATIKCAYIVPTPANPSPEVQGIVIIQGAQNVTIDGFVISGPAQNGNSHNLESGILVDNGGSANITHNYITNIRDITPVGPTPFSQDGIGIAVGATYTHTNKGVFQTGKAVITGNTFDFFQKGAILVDGYNSFATITGNAINGAPGTALFQTKIARFGIQVSNLAGADIENNSITNIIYTGPGFSAPDFAVGFGITIQSPVGSRPGLTVLKSNTIGSCDESVRLKNAVFVTVSGNSLGTDTLASIVLDKCYACTVTNNLVGHNLVPGADSIDLLDYSYGNKVDGNYDNGFGSANVGILLDVTTYNNTVTNNKLTNNGNFDYEDFSSGSGTAGTANFWSGNTGTKNPAGLG